MSLRVVLEKLYDEFKVNVDFSDIMDMLETAEKTIVDTEYQAFDPVLFRQYLPLAYFKINKLKGVAEDVKKFKTDLMKAIGIYISCGTKVTEKRLSKMSEAGQATYNNIKKAFNLSNDTNDATAITMQRIAACFPVTINRLYKSDESKRNYRIPGGVNPNLDYSLHFSNAISIIPLTPEWATTRAEHFRWCLSFDEVINKGTATDVGVVFGYHELQKKSGLIAADIREKLMIDLKISKSTSTTTDNESVEKYKNGTLVAKTVTVPKVTKTITGTAKKLPAPAIA